MTDLSANDSLATDRLVFLLDVDNTLLDNDRLKADIGRRIADAISVEGANRFWELYEAVRREKDFVDYPTTIQRWTEAAGDPDSGRAIEDVLNTIPFADYLYPRVLETVARLESFGTVAILSDGDPLFQPRKIRKSGLEAAVHGNVLVLVHKEEELPAVFRRFPADHYVVVDDKPRILAALERDCPTTFTTIMVLQGKYAIQGQFTPEPDFVIPWISDLETFERAQFLKS